MEGGDRMDPVTLRVVINLAMILLPKVIKAIINATHKPHITMTVTTHVTPEITMTTHVAGE
jgi:hypothetical protein